MENSPKLLIVDDERVALKNLEYVMKKEGYDVISTQSGSNAIRYLDEQRFDVVLTDLRMERVDGLQVLKKCRELHPDTEIIMITGFATLESAVNIMKQGAFSYIAKPFKLDEVRAAVKEAVEKVRLKRENRQLHEQVESFQEKVKIITQDPVMRKPLDNARQIAQVDSPVFIRGERGTGKELFARFIHANSRRASGPFLRINCKAFSEELLIQELFGHEKGIATESSAMKKGMIENATEGTLYLDEITAMPESVQSRLLRVLEEKEVQRVGGIKPVKVDVRFIASADKELLPSAQDGSMRQDLYYRLNVVSLHLPPLADRKEDISLLAYHFLKKHAALSKKNVSAISPEVIAVLLEYDYPGNVRELENIIERGVALTNGEMIELAHLPDTLKELNIKTFRKREGKIPSLDEQEMAYIKWVLGEVAGNKTAAAQILGIDRVSLWRKLKKYGLESQE